ncbi:MAG: DUF2188 domain-containing protein [Actinobacteria bacterium]|nr:DUF2188 domain-containing protein [Actinomycetota bacterium]
MSYHERHQQTAGHQRNSSIHDSRRETPVAKKDVHVTPDGDGGWKVMREEAQRASSLHGTQAQAATEGRRLARQDHVEFNLHDKKGRVREKDSYGNDNYPPKG